MSSFISIFKILCQMGLGFLALLIVAEIILQCLPVKTGFKRPETIAEGMPPHWQPNQSFTYSAGWRMDNPQTGWINNKGYPTPVDFTDGTQAIIVIGDSFVENQMNAWDESFMGRMAKDKDTPVYAFGLSGANVADYIGIAHYASATYKPTHMVVVLQPGDLGSADAPYQTGHYYIQQDNHTWSLHQQPYSHKNAKIRNFFKQSALIRYLMMNLQIQRKLTLPTTETDSTAKPAPDYNDRYRYMISDLCKLARQGNFDITIVTDSEELSPSDFQKGARQCSRIELVDALKMKNDLEAEHPHSRLTHEPYDGHWNATMHGYVYDLIKPTL